MAQLACPHCGFSREVPDASIPDGSFRVICPKCRNKFDFSKSAAASAAGSPAESAPQPEPAAPPPPRITAEQFDKIKKIGGQTPHEHAIKPLNQLFSDSWELYKTRMGVLIGLYLLIVVLMLVPLGICVGLAVMASRMMDSSFPYIIGGTIGCLLATAGAWWGAASLACAVVDDRRGFGDALREGWHMFLPYAWIISLFSFFVLGGSMLFLIPGIIFTVWFMFAQYIVLKENVRGMTALLKSRAYVKGRWFPIFGRLFLIAFIASALSAIPFAGPVLSLFVYPYMFTYLYVMYEDLRDIRPLPSFSASGAEKRSIYLTTAAGYVVMIFVSIYAVNVIMTRLPAMTMQSAAIPKAPVAPKTNAPVVPADTGQEEAVRAVYEQYRTAMAQSDIPALKRLVTRDKAQELDDPNVAKMLATARQFMPESDISSIAVAGQSATIQLASKDKTSTGTVILTREGMDWKVVSEKWQMRMEGAGAPAQPGSAPPPAAPSPDKQ